MCLTSCNALISRSSFTNSPIGALRISNSNVTAQEIDFSGNNPQSQQYPSYRRNVVCDGLSSLDVVSLRGGDGVNEGDSLWILNKGCTLKGVAASRPSSFFVPTLLDVSSTAIHSSIELIFNGTLLLPCGLSFQVTSSSAQGSVSDLYRLSEYVSESVAVGSIPLSVVANASSDTEVSVCILYQGSSDAAQKLCTNSIVLKNGSKAGALNDGGGISDLTKRQIITFASIGGAVVVAVVAFVIIMIVLVKYKRKKSEKIVDVKLSQSTSELDSLKNEELQNEGCVQCVPIQQNTEADFASLPAVSSECILQNSCSVSCVTSCDENASDNEAEKGKNELFAMRSSTDALLSSISQPNGLSVLPSLSAESSCVPHSPASHGAANLQSVAASECNMQQADANINSNTNAYANANANANTNTNNNTNTSINTSTSSDSIILQSSGSSVYSSTEGSLNIDLQSFALSCIPISFKPSKDAIMHSSSLKHSSLFFFGE